MPKITFFFVLMFSCLITKGQDLSITFTGTGAADHIDSIAAVNLRTNQRVTFPGDATLMLTMETGIPPVTELISGGMVFPNPFSGKATFSTVVEKPQSVDLKVQNMVGQVVAQLKKDIIAGESRFELSVSTAGIYLVSITTERGTTGYKIISTEGGYSPNSILFIGTDPAMTRLKGSLTGYALGYAPGDMILYTCTSGNYTTILTTTPTTSVNIEVVLNDCTDPGGKTYKTVIIGKQTWMAENLAWLPAVFPSGTGSGTFPLYYVYGYEGTSVSLAKATYNYPMYGVLYNWPAAQTACPAGWHMPDYGEWYTLTSYLGSDIAGKVLKAPFSWYNQTNYFYCGFDARPGGSRTSFGFFGKDIHAQFWTIYESETPVIQSKGLDWNLDVLYNMAANPDEGISLRCLKNSIPGVTTNPVTDKTSNSAICGGTVTTGGGLTVTARGVCWDRTVMPTIAGNHTVDGSGTGTFVSMMGNLVPNTFYVVRAYATNSAGTAYGEQMVFTTLPGFSCGSPITVNHTAGLVAPVSKTVTYGTVTNIPGEPAKCWITSNLGADRQATAVSDASESSAGWYWQFNRKQGYKHDGTTRTPNTAWISPIDDDSDWMTSNDPCAIELGSGWRIPTATEWNNVNGGGGWSNWNGPWNSGLKLHAAGSLYNGNRINAGSFGQYWSRTQYYYLMGGVFYFTNTYSLRDNLNKDGGLSVRCIKETSGEPVIPALTTTAINNISSGSASSGGTVTSDGGANITALGVCWSTSPAPTMLSNHSNDGSGFTAFTSKMDGLSAGTKYYVRAYATNSAGTGYGNELNVTTPAAPVSCGSVSVTHQIIGGVAPVGKTVTYATVRNIGGEPSNCWITSNLGASREATGVDDNTEPSAGWYWQFNRKQGYGYEGSVRTPNTAWVASINENSGWLPENDPCVLELGSIWHVPTYTEWANVRASGNWTSWNGPWNSGLKLHAAGRLEYSNGALEYKGEYGNYWSNQQNNMASSNLLSFYNRESYANTVQSKAYGSSVRCVRDAGSSVTTPTVYTNPAFDVSANSATSGGIITGDGGAAVIIRGVCWGTGSNLSLASSLGHSSDGPGTGTFTSLITGLAPNTDYTYRAYATNSAGTAYGQEYFLTTASACSFTDARDSKVYKCIKIGSQTWMAENLAWLPEVSTSISVSSPRYYVNGFTGEPSVSAAKATANFNTYGVLYNWPAAKAACPAGWHLASDGEWKILEIHQGMSEADASGTGTRLSGTAGGKLKETGTTHWNSPNTGATNSSGFTALPGGDFNLDGYRSPGNNGSFWTASEYNEQYAWYRSFSSQHDGVDRDYLSEGKHLGYSVRCVKDDPNSIRLPEVTTNPVREPTSNSATGGGFVNHDGRAAVTVRGVCWSTSSPPTIANSKSIDGAGTGLFTTNISGLTANTTYYVRAYATNSVGTAYGQELVFKTLVDENCTFTDTRDSKTYKCITIGTQKWMAENLAWLPSVTPSANGSAATPFYYVYGYQGTSVSIAKAAANYTAYGVLYNWQAAQSACPSGWHLPTDIEWGILELNQGMENSEISLAGWRNTGQVGSKLKKSGTAQWIDPNTATNLSGFTALPGGQRLNAGNYNGIGEMAGFWSSTESTIPLAWDRVLLNFSEAAGRFNHDRSFGYSVRCVKDTGTGVEVPTVSTSPVTGLTTNSALSGGNVTSDGGAAVTERGVCWSTSANPTITGEHSHNGSGSGTFASNLINLTPNTDYFVRAYAINSAGTGYGLPVTFKTLPASCTFTDTRDSKVYKCIQIGTQIWMAENLAWLPAVSPPTEASQDLPYYYVYGYSGTVIATAKAAANYTTYGVLYNWPASRMACPAGWHLPTGAELDTLTKYLGSSAGNKMKETGTAHWLSPNSDATNSSGFTALPAGYRNGDIPFHGLGNYTGYWSDTEINPIQSVSYTLSAGSAEFYPGTSLKDIGFSIRCVKDDMDVIQVPRVTTSPVTDKTSNSAKSGGNVFFNGMSSVTDRGVCWSLVPNPTINNDHTHNSSGTGTFISEITGLVPNTIYYIRAYATNWAGTGYGSQLSFLTGQGFSCGTPVTRNHDGGNVAPVNKTVTYGTVTNIPGEPTKCWITSNLGAGHQAGAVNDATEASAGWYWQFNRKQGYKHDGTTRTPNTTWVTAILENVDWQAENDPCTLLLGSGWRIPTPTEWTNVDAAGTWTNWNGPWNSELKLHAAGFLAVSTGGLYDAGGYGGYWSSKWFSTDASPNLAFSSTGSSIDNGNKAYGFSVRCIRD